MMRELFCPICKLKVDREVENFPFCSERCRVIDLGNWSDGSYAIPAEPANLNAGEGENVGEEGDEERLH